MSGKVILGVIILITVAVYSYNKNNYDPIEFNGEIYSYSDSFQRGKVKNIFFTPGGVKSSSSTSYMQILDFNDSSISESNIKLLRQQLSATMALKPLEDEVGRYFGMFRGVQPMYAVEKGRTFLIFSTEEGLKGNEESLREEANEVLDKLDNVLLPKL